ncbi:TIGR01621 family pseudouridine synthase [Colwelliaceae bacterium 6471]
MDAINGFELVDEQAHFIICNKAPDVNFHDEGTLGSGLFNQIKLRLKQDELYPVHRLDKMTSGLIIFAKTKTAAQQFQRIFCSHELEKFYIAISDQKPKKKQGLIKGDMAKSRRGSWKLLRSQENPAISQFFSYSIGDGQRLYLIKPHSGKTHQIRVALSSIGAAIIGDRIYHSQSNVDRGYLHAYALKFTLDDQTYQYLLPPTTGEHFLSTALRDELTKIGAPWQLNWPKV